MGITVRMESCDHVAGYADWVRNDGHGPPVILLEFFRSGPHLVTMTNQVIYVKCPACFEATRQAALSKY